MSQEITKEQIAAFDADFSAQRANRVAMNAVTNNGLLASAIRREAVEQDVHEYSISLEQGEICNQKQSGRCWMFAALNTLRYQVTSGVQPKLQWIFPSLESVLNLALAQSLCAEEPVLRVCKNCGKIYYNPHARSEFCSVRCRNQYNVRAWRSRQRENG